MQKHVERPDDVALPENSDQPIGVDLHTNVDPQEIDKFNALAERWWDLEGEFKPLHQMNSLRMDYILEKSNGLFGKKVLDVGCGGGILTEGLAKEQAEVTGIDLGSEALRVARQHAQAQGLSIHYQEIAAEAHAAHHPQQYDVVTCMEMLEHVPDPAAIVRACASMVKPGGHVFFSTINRSIQSYALAIIAAEHLLKMVPKGTHHHSKFIRPSELLQMVDQTALCEQHITGVGYQPLLGHFYTTKRVDVNYMLHTQKMA